MKKAWMALIAVALLALPATASAHQPKPLVKNAAKYCKEQRNLLGVETFRQTYGGKHAFGKCVSKRVHELRAARRAAVLSCKEQLGTSGHKFRHDKPENRAAFRKCVREQTQATTSDDQEGVLNAAKACKAERALDEDAFAVKYGTNHNKRNAFGKCVSQHADDEDENEPETGHDDDGPENKPSDD